MRILFFYPENPLLQTQGNNARAFALLEYFKSRNITVDLVGQQQHLESLYNQQHIQELCDRNLINTGWILKRTKHKGLRYFFYSLKQKIGYFFNEKIKDYDRLRMGQKEAFLEIYHAKKYDYLLLSYVYNYPLIENENLANTIKIIDTHDFLTSQFQNNRNFQLGRFFHQEMKILNQFDAVWGISTEECYLFSQFLKSKVHLIPHTVENNLKQSATKKAIDIFYVASENSHNIRAAKWFFSRVYPLLNSELTIVVVGKVGKHIPDFKNVKKIEFAANLETFYAESKIVICPMLTGTGLKIKVVEALSYGVPVVCNTRGVDGLINKTNNGCLVTDHEEEMAEYITKLLTDSDFYKKINLQAEAFFIENLARDKVYKRLDTFFNLERNKPF